MAIEYHYFSEKTKFDRRTLTELQHKLRVVLKCYTVTDFALDENNHFVFRKKYRHYKSKIIVNDTKWHRGEYRKEETAVVGKYKITILIHE